MPMTATFPPATGRLPRIAALCEGPFVYRWMQDRMTTPYQTPDYDDDAPDFGPAPIKTEYKFSHVTTKRYLPTPGKAPG